MTDTTPVSEQFLTHSVALAIVDAFAKFKECGFIPKKDHVMTQTTPLSGKFFTLGVGLAVVDPLAKFKQRSLIHSRNIEGV